MSLLLSLLYNEPLDKAHYGGLREEIQGWNQRKTHFFQRKLQRYADQMSLLLSLKMIENSNKSQKGWQN